MQPQQNKTSQSSIRRQFSSLIMLVVLLAVGSVTYAERQPIHDWLALRNYQAPADVAALAHDDTMSAYAEHMYYINHPAIENKASFAQECPGDTEKTIVLGCYVGGEDGIYVLGVSDPRLAGVEQVTAAHEMLHAAYDRLSSADRKNVDAMLMDYYQHGLTDARIKATIASYKQSEPDQLINEMHSVFGTEVAHLPGPLETYYKKYFSNRQAVTAFAANYEKAFTDREKQLAADKAQLDSLKSEIKSKEGDLSSREASLNAQQSMLERERSRGNIEAYNAGVDGYNADVAAARQEWQDIQILISEYNQIVSEYNSIVLQEQQLTNDLQVPASPSSSH